MYNHRLITVFVTRVTQRVEQEMLTLPGHMSSPPVCSGVRVTRSLVFYVVFCISLFVPLSFFFWPLCCLSFDFRILITPLVSYKLFLDHNKLQQLRDLLR
jgi:hypothetical protein